MTEGAARLIVFNAMALLIFAAASSTRAAAALAASRPRRAAAARAAFASLSSPSPPAQSRFGGRRHAARMSSSPSLAERPRRVRAWGASLLSSYAKPDGYLGDDAPDGAGAGAGGADPLSDAFSVSASEYLLPSPRSDVITDLRPGRRIVSFGDVHGDLGALKQFLVTAGVMDPDSSLDDPAWNGGDTICVQCGDVLDRGDDELACFRALASLSRQAEAGGGALILLFGNHESLNSAGLFQYANPGGNVEFELTVGSTLDSSLGTNRWRLQYGGNQPSRWAAFEPGGLLADSLMGNMRVAAVVGRTAFVHAGLTAEHLRRHGGLKGMNRQAREWVLRAHHREHNLHGSYQTIEEVIASAQRRAKSISGNMPECLGGGVGSPSPVWMRDYSSPPDDVPKNPGAQRMIDECLEELGAEAGGEVVRMVMGHTPQSCINAALKGRAWRVDVGASRGVMGGTPEVLEIIHGEREDEVNVLTVAGERISGRERQVLEQVWL